MKTLTYSLAFIGLLGTVLVGGCDAGGPDGDKSPVDGGKADVQGGDEGVCGGFAGFSCEEDEICVMPDGTCGWADMLGTCEPAFDVCTALWAPVCGCDGQTYGNRCEANLAGMTIDHEGECGPAVGQEGESCGGWTGPYECADGLFCDWEPGQWCGGSDIPGTCRPIPQVCTEIYAPVCGCDQETYGNQCYAAMAGVGTFEIGECEDDSGGDTGDGEPCGDTVCGDGMVCCNSSCGICTEPGGACIQIACD